MTENEKPRQNNPGEFEEVPKPRPGEPRNSQSGDSAVDRREEQDDEKSERQFEREH